MALRQALAFATARPGASRDGAVRQANAAHARAMPMPRMLDYGMSYADAAALHAMAEDEVPWVAAAEWLGACNAERARAAATSPSRSRALLAASACYRFAQSAIDGDSAERKRLYRMMMDSFAAGVALLPAPPEKLALETGAGPLCGWLFEPVIGTGAMVVVFGGADGWREAYYLLVADLLAEGLAVCLLDMPGQGESRLFHGVCLRRGFETAMDRAIRTLKQRYARVGLWGNSLGGTLAASVAIESDAVDAVCSNSGSARPAELGEKFPRVLDRIAAMAGATDRETGAATLAMLDLTGRLDRMTCPVLVLHGAQDALFSAQSVQPLHDLAGSDDRTMITWADGEHCMYSRAVERNALVAAWFGTRLGQGG